jgi:hypothetical protein
MATTKGVKAKSVAEEATVQDEITTKAAVEEAIYPGGPTQSQVDQWKELYGQIYMTEVDEDDAFIWRVLNRKEFKDILKIDGADAMYREERVCEACILWPEGYSFDNMAGGKAGVPTVLSEQIMEKSGFAPKTGPVAL